MSFMLALLMIIEIALWHREGMSYMLGGSASWRIVEACVDVLVVCFMRSGSGVGLCVGCVVGSLLVLRRLAALRSFVGRLSCLLSAWVRGVCIFSGFGVGHVCAIGQFFLRVRGMCLAF